MKKIKKTNNNHIDERFDKVDQKLAQVDKRFTQVDERFDKVDQKFTKVDERFDQVDQKFNEVNDQIIQLKKDLSSEMLNWKVEIVGEIKAMREEFDTHQYSHLRINETLEDHEKRLTSHGAPAM